MSVDLSQNTQKLAQPHKPKNMVKTDNWAKNLVMSNPYFDKNKPNKLNNWFNTKMAWKLDISDLDIPLKLSTWLDISVEPPCVTYE